MIFRSSTTIVFSPTATVIIQHSNDTNVSFLQLFVKGVVNQEEQQEVSYPDVLHCVFCGARGLFMDCLIRSTSAHIVVSVFVL